MTLDDAYANMDHIPDGAGYPARWEVAAEAFRAGAKAELGVAYGPTNRQFYDLFQPAGTATGKLVFVHGGYWLRFGPRDFSHLAAGAVAAGWQVATPGYSLCPAVRVAGITAQIAQAITAIAERTEGPLVLAGHSAGGHLVSRMGGDRLPKAVRARVLRTVPISPVSDLRPLRHTALNDGLRLDPAEAAAESPALHPAPDWPVHVWVGAAERPAFLDQAYWLAEAWGAPLTIDPDRHHFDVIEGLERPGPLLSACLDG